MMWLFRDAFLRKVWKICKTVIYCVTIVTITNITITNVWCSFSREYGLKTNALFFSIWKIPHTEKNWFLSIHYFLLWAIQNRIELRKHKRIQLSSLMYTSYRILRSIHLCLMMLYYVDIYLPSDNLPSTLSLYVYL